MGNDYNAGSYDDLNDYHQPMSLEHGMISMEGKEWGESNTNTLETMSAKSFGSFVRPSPKIREDDIAKRIQRHQSFFEVEHRHPHMATRQNVRTNFESRDTSEHNHNAFNKHYYPSNGNAVRRAESFQHNTRSLIDFDYNQASNKLQKQSKSGKGSRCESSMDLFGKRYVADNNKPNLHKAKSMEFLKSKLLPRKLPPPNPSPSPSISSPFTKSGAGIRSHGIKNGISHSPTALNPNGKCNIGNKAISVSNMGHPSQGLTSRQRSQSPWSAGRDDVIQDSSQHSWIQVAVSSSAHHGPIKENGKPSTRTGRNNSTKTGKNDYDWRQDTPFWNGKKPSLGTRGKIESQAVSVSHEEIIGPWQHLPHLHPRSSSINPIMSPTQHHQSMHPANGWHNHPVYVGSKNGAAVNQYPIPSQGLFLGAMRRFSPTPYLPPNNGPKSGRLSQASTASVSPQSIPNIHLPQPSHFAGIHPVPFGNVMNAQQLFRPSQSSNAAPMPSITSQFPQHIPVPFNPNMMNISRNGNNISLGIVSAVSSEKLSDRLEITELSDQENEGDSSHQTTIPSKSSIPNGHNRVKEAQNETKYSPSQQKVPPAHLRRQQPKAGGLNANRNGGENIFDMPSGMY